MQTDDYRIGILNLILLAVSAGLWVDLVRYGLRQGWSWPLVPRQPVPWRTFEAVAFVVAVLLCVTSLMLQLFKLPTPPPYSLRHLQVNCLSQVMQLTLLTLVLSLWCRCQWADFGIRRQGVLEDLRFGLWGVLLAQLPVTLLSLPLNSLRESKPHAMFEFLRDSNGDQYSLLWIALTVVVMAPLFEEFLFRVVLQGALEREVSPIWAILLTTAAFVSTHSMVDWLPLLPLALILGYLYHRRRSYLTVVVLHSVFNGLNLLSAVWSLQSSATP